MFKGITRNVWILAVVSLLTDVSSEMLYPLIPIFLATVLHAPATIIGLIEGIAESTAAFLKVISGWLSDRMGRRRLLVIAGYGASALGKPLLAVSYVWPAALFARFVDRFGKGVRTAPRDALLAESVAAADRGRAFGLHRALDTMGAVLGPLAALALLAAVGNNFRLIFVLALIPAALGMVFLFLVREKPRGAASGAPGAPGAPATGEPLPFRLAFRQLPRQFKVFLVITAVFAAGNSSDVFLLLKAQDFGFSTSLVVGAYVIYNLAYSLTSFPAGALSDRIGRTGLITGGFAAFSLVYLGFALASAAYHYWILFAIYGIYQGLTDGVGKAYVVDLVPETRRASLLGLYHTTLSILTFAASLTGGLLWDLIAPAATFYYGAATAAAAALLLLIFAPRPPKPAEAAT